MEQYLSQIIDLLRQISLNTINRMGWISTLVSTVVGVVIGGSLTHILQNIGKTNMYIKTVSFSFRKDRGFQDSTVRLADDPDRGVMDLQIDLQNNSMRTRHIRDIRIEIRSKREKCSLIPYDKSTTRFSSDMPVMDKLAIVNLSPGSAIEIELRALLDRNHISLIKQKPTVHFCFRTESNKVKRLPITDLNKNKLA